ncbi:hypothetical protein QE385_001209 [Sphingomonas sp. SORGH_AS 950]|nr:hypothetical protein [Sphingomonas sp. SORGH_AS_0950]
MTSGGACPASSASRAASAMVAAWVSMIACGSSAWLPA